MHTNHYYIEMMLKERRKQFLAEAQMLRLIKIAPSTKIKREKTLPGFVSRFFDGIRITLLKKREPTACGCQ